MQPKTYTVDQIFAILNLTPEAFLRDYGRNHVVDPYSDDPRFVLGPKDEIEVKIDLPPGSVDFRSIGYNREYGIFGLSAMGDLPTTFATKYLSAINWRRLEVDKAGHSHYGYFPTERREHSHFLMEMGSTEAIRIEQIDGKPVAKFEFAIARTGNPELYCLVGNRVCQSNIRIHDIKKGDLNWKPVVIPNNPDVNDFSTRIIEGKVGTMLATRNGLHLWHNGEFTTYQETRGKNVIAVVVGIPACRISETLKEGDMSRMAYVIRRDDGCIELFTTTVNPNGKVLPVEIEDKNVRTAKSNVYIFAGNNNRWYLGTSDKVTAIEIPRC
jgi:hypothetical protein